MGLSNSQRNIFSDGRLTQVTKDGSGIVVSHLDDYHGLHVIDRFDRDGYGGYDLSFKRQAPGTDLGKGIPDHAFHG